MIKFVIVALLHFYKLHNNNDISFDLYCFKYVLMKPLVLNLVNKSVI